MRDNNGGRIVSLAPSVNNTPVGASMVPVPCPMVDFCGHDGGYASSVRMTGNAAMLHRSITLHVHGDAPGGGGVASGTVGGICEPIGHAPQVRAEGSFIMRDGDLCYINNRNTVGECQWVRDPGVYAPASDRDPLPGSAATAAVAAAPSTEDAGAVTRVSSGFGPWLAGAQPSARQASNGVASDGGGGSAPPAGVQQAQLPPTFFFRPSPIYIPPEQLSSWLRPLPPIPPVLPVPPTLPGPPPVPEPGPGLQPETTPGLGNGRVTPERCPFQTVCFYPSDQLDLVEYRRQLKMQEDVLNGKTPAGYLRDRAYFEIRPTKAL